MSSPSTSPSCIWTLGFRSGERCRHEAAAGKRLCTGHGQAQSRIAQKRRALADADETLSAARAQERAEKWWFKTGARFIPQGLYDEVMVGKPCGYCGDPVIHEADHIIPVTRGGLSERDNLVAACKRCNAEKNNQTPDEWREWRLSQGLPWPPKTKQERINDLTDALLNDDNPPEHLAPLCGIAARLMVLGLSGHYEQYSQHPDWQAANACFTAAYPQLQKRELADLRYAAIEVMYRIESAYETDAGKAAIG